VACCCPPSKGCFRAAAGALQEGYQQRLHPKSRDGQQLAQDTPLGLPAAHSLAYINRPFYNMKSHYF